MVLQYPYLLFLSNLIHIWYNLLHINVFCELQILKHPFLYVLTLWSLAHSQFGHSLYHQTKVPSPCRSLILYICFEREDCEFVLFLLSPLCFLAQQVIQKIPHGLKSLFYTSFNTIFESFCDTFNYSDYRRNNHSCCTFTHTFCNFSNC